MTTAAPLIDTGFFSHGTIETTDMVATRRFLVDFLGLDIIRPLKEAQYMWKNGRWIIVCVNIQDGEPKAQGPENHFKLTVGSDAEVDRAHDAAMKHKDEYGIKQVLKPEKSGRHRSFKLLDLNNTWWEISTIAQRDYDALFERGDYTH